MTEDDLIILCPNCRCKIGFDETGTEYLMELENQPKANPGERIGLGGLKTFEAAGNPNWIQESYFFNDGSKSEKTSIQAPGVAGSKTKRQRKKKPAAEMTDEMQSALDKDLSQRNIKLNQTETND